jgi:2-dehydro-3-deoxyglucarate aldolase
MKSFSHNISLLKHKLRLKKTTLGTWITIPHQSIIEILATAGFEWMVLDLEHSPMDYQQMQNLIAHIQGNGMEALVRVAKNDEVQIKKALDAGANGIIVPMIKTLDDAKRVIKYSKYPPIGERGVGLSRANHYGNKFQSYVEWHQKELVIVFQVEHIDAVNNLDDILSTDGLDGIIIGPYDLSASLGKPGEFDDPDVAIALKKVVETTLSSNVSLGFHEISSDYKNVIEKFNLGYNFIAFSLDFNFLGNSAREQMNQLSKFI